MQANPYSPPGSSVEAELAPRPPRPIAVWLLALALLVAVVTAAAGSLRFLWFVMSHLDAVQSYGTLTVSIIWRVALVALLVAVLVGVFRGRNWSRWMGVLVIACFAAWSVLGPDSTVYASAAEKAGGNLARMFILPLLMAWWIWTFGFTDKARRYFRDAG